MLKHKNSELRSSNSLCFFTPSVLHFLNLKSVQPVNFLCFVSFFHEKEMKSPTRLERIGVWGQGPKKETKN